MRTIIAGSRSCSQIDIVRALQLCPFTNDISLVLSGTARGADTYGEKWARAHNLPIERYPADWSRGKSAGLDRNWEMVDRAEALLAVWDGVSRGTKHVIEAAKSRGLRVYVHGFEPQSIASHILEK